VDDPGEKREAKHSTFCAPRKGLIIYCAEEGQTLS